MSNSTVDVDTWWIVVQIERLAKAGEKLASSDDSEPVDLQAIFEVISEKSADLNARMGVPLEKSREAA